MIGRIHFLLAVFSLAAPAARAPDDVPDWVIRTAATAVPAYSAKVSSVVLFQEEAVTVDPDGRRVMRERGAVKILQSGGDSPRAFRSYNTKDGRIRDFQGWLVPPAGKPTVFPKNRVLDVALSQQYTFDEARAKILECGAALPGSVFAWEVTEEERSVFTQYAYDFQDRLPVLFSRFSLTLPAGWETKAVVLNHAQLDPQVNGSTYTWELRDLPALERELHSPTLAALAPRLGVSYFPPSDNRAGLQGLKDWPAVSTWLASLVDPPAEPTESVRARAAVLTVGASSEFDKIRAIGAFVQRTNYVEVALNITRGGGYTPHRSEETLARNYGDCKDKATLMRALLKAVGIDSYLTVIDAEDRTYVRSEWASPQQFDHAIVAIRVSGDASFHGAADTPVGRLLFFDPTDPITPAGDLPSNEQGSYALVIAGSRGDLLRVPQFAADDNRVESSIQAVIDPDGHLEAKIERQYFGQSASLLRFIESRSGPDELKKRFEREFSRTLGGTTLGTVAAHPEDNRLTVDLDLKAERFGQTMQGKLFVVRPGLLTSGGDYYFNSRQRSLPVKMEADLRHDTVRIKIPPGLKLDELPAPIKVDSPYGSLSADWKVEDGEILMNLTLEIKAVVSPVAEYAQVRDFFDHVAGAQSAPVVLVKQ